MTPPNGGLILMQLWEHAVDNVFQRNGTSVIFYATMNGRLDCRGKHVSDIIFILAMNGLVWGLIIALIALGLSIIFGLLDIINVAHGDFFMLGTVFAWTVILLTGNFW